MILHGVNNIFHKSTRYSLLSSAAYRHHVIKYYPDNIFHIYIYVADMSVDNRETHTKMVSKILGSFFVFQVVKDTKSPRVLGLFLKLLRTNGSEGKGN